MSIGLVGRKCGMTRVFTETGNSIPVTVIEVVPNRITQVKTPEVDGYRAIQITAGSRLARHVNKSLAGHYAKAKVEAGNMMREFRLAEGEMSEAKAGDQLNVELFNEAQMVDVIATSKGKGFAGVVKRHNFHMQDATHGNSLSHRAPGSIGQCQTPGRVFKGKKMAGQMGNVKCTVQNQQIVKVDVERNLILVSGTVPGAPGGTVVIMPAMKTKTKRGGQ
ncbi:MAG: 50S ribosomal protein L3 [Gammaproteobacteria bacterium]|nr:50S ribosomal protein L3 [Gammaproteobacteria bacterium]